MMTNLLTEEGDTWNKRNAVLQKDVGNTMDRKRRSFSKDGNKKSDFYLTIGRYSLNV